MNFYKHYIGDFQRDTGHLSLTERGAYRALLDAFYASEKPLPKAAPELCRLVGAFTKAERDAIVRVLKEFWQQTDDGWVNGRALKEIAKAGHQREVNRGIAEAREAARRSHEQSTNRATTASPIQTPDSIHQTVLQPSSPVPNLSASPARARGETREGGARDVPRETVEAIRVAYPPGLYRGADWLLAERAIRDRAAEGVDPAELLAAAQAYGAQQQALEKAGTQYVLKPSRFFGSDDWRGPFPLPAKPENAYDRIMRLNGGAPDNSTVIEHEPDIPGPSRLRLA